MVGFSVKGIALISNLILRKFLINILSKSRSVKLLLGYISAGRACCTVTDRRTGVRPAQLGENG